MNNSEAYFLREITGTSGLEATARMAVERLADHNTPHLIGGGLAAQEHGYPRVTVDVDIVVPDVHDAVEELMAELSGPFVREPGLQDRVRDKRTGVLVNLLPAGQVLKAGCQVPFPIPLEVTETVQPVVRELYEQTWDALQAER